MANMIPGTAAFDSILTSLRPALVARAFELLDARESPEAFGSRYATFGDGQRVVRLTWDGKERWFVLEGDAEPHQSATGLPVWADLTLQRFDPAQADDRWVAEVASDVLAAFEEFAG